MDMGHCGVGVMTDPDALTLILWCFIWCGLMLSVAGVCHLMTKRKWPEGHGQHYFDKARKLSRD